MGQRSGELRDRVKIQKPITTKNQFGHEEQSWQDHVVIWAKVTPLSARDLIAARADQAEIVARLKIRYRTDITSDMRVMHKGRVYDIASPAQDDASTGYEYCTFLLSSGVVKFEG